jgi:Mn2+/Fe2+ NRAMP family transporter
VKKKTIETQKTMKLPRVLAYLALLSYLAGIVAASIEATISANNNPADWRALDIAHTVSTWGARIFVIFSLYIAAKLAWRYWPARSVNVIKKYDERQKDMREKTMEWAYRSFGVWALITLFFGNVEGDASRGYTIWMLIGLFFFMPSLVAIHRKGA